MTTNQDRAVEVMRNFWHDGRYAVGFDEIADALADEGLLAPDLIASTPVPLEPGDRNFVIDHLMENRQRANILGNPGMTEAWEAAANAFADATQEKK